MKTGLLDTLCEVRSLRSKDVQRTAMWTTVSTEELVPADHPLRATRLMVDAALRELSPIFAKLYSPVGRPSIAPEKQLRAMLLQMFYTIRSERMLMEQLQYNMLFRWFVGLSIDDQVWDVTVFTKNRERFLDGNVAQEFFAAVLEQARAADLLSAEHFTVDGTLIEAWASHKSFKPIDDQKPPTGGGSNPDVSFKAQKRSNATHRSTTDPDARLCRKGPNTGAQLAYMGHALMENRSGLAVDGRLTLATGTAERAAALEMVGALGGRQRITLGADKGYDSADFVTELRIRAVTPHIAQNDTARRSAIDKRTTRHEGYGVSQRKRKRVEEIFGWQKVVGGIRKVRVRGLQRVGATFTFTLAAFNLTRMRNLIPVAT
jgi:transposase